MGWASFPRENSKATFSLSLSPWESFLWYLPSREWLLVIFAHPVLWQWTNLLFLGGSVVTVLGLVLLTTILWAAGDHALAPLGLSAFFFGTGLWVIQLVFRLSVDLWAAQETARTGVVPTVYEPLNLWIRSLHHSHKHRLSAFLCWPGLGGCDSELPWELHAGLGVFGPTELAATGLRTALSSLG